MMFTVNNFGSSFGRESNFSDKWDFPVAYFKTREEAERHCEKLNGCAVYKSFRVEELK